MEGTKVEGIEASTQTVIDTLTGNLSEANSTSTESLETLIRKTLAAAVEAEMEKRQRDGSTTKSLISGILEKLPAGNIVNTMLGINELPTKEEGNALAQLLSTHR